MVNQTVKFNNGNTYPALGLGTWKSKPNEVSQAVKDAIDIGYRHIDCAPVYQNEKEVGEALKAKITEGVVSRKDIYVTSKLWNTYHRPEVVETALKRTLNDLGLEYLDLYLMHWPFAFKEGDNIFPTDSDGKVQFADVDYVDTWKAMEALYEKGLVKNIGVSNFNSKQIERILSVCKVKPVTNQVECHPYLAQLKLSDYCKSKGITLTAYSPFCSPDRAHAKPDDPKILEDAQIKKIAAQHGRTPAQIVLRYQLQRGHLVVPKSVTKSRIQENFNIFDFNLSEDEVSLINSLDCHKRVCDIPGTAGHKYYSFNDEF